MAYDKILAARIRAALHNQPGLTEKEMFGGVGFMLQGNMACGVIGDSLISRVGPDAYAEAMQKPYTHQFDMTGRPMKGWVVVDAQGVDNEESLHSWVDLGIKFANCLPPKK
jgi:TfoX/Sxy family transcriptional regulator of competence genes